MLHCSWPGPGCHLASTLRRCCGSVEDMDGRQEWGLHQLLLDTKESSSRNT
jgi:hypothetical protein